MTRETKVGLVVAGSFLCLVCIVVASKLRRGDEPPKDLTEEQGHPLAALNQKQNGSTPEPKKKDVAPRSGPVSPPVAPPKKSEGAGEKKSVAPMTPSSDLPPLMFPSRGAGDNPPLVVPPRLDLPPLPNGPGKEITIPQPTGSGQLPPLAFPPATKENTPVFPPVTKENTPAFPPVTKENTPAFPPVTKENTPAFPPVTKENTPAFPPVTKENTPLFPAPVVIENPPALPPLAGKETPPGFPPVVKETPPVVKETTPGFPPLGMPMPLAKDMPPPLTFPKDAPKTSTVPPITNSEPIPRIGSNDLPNSPPITIGSNPGFNMKPLPPVKNQTTEPYRLKDGENTFAILSQRLYGTDSYAEALAAFNRDLTINKQTPILAPGRQIEVPPASILERDYRPYVRTGSASPIPTIPPSAPLLSKPMPLSPGISTISVQPSSGQSRSYTVQSPAGESILDIAERVLGDRSQWHKIWRVNQSYQPQFRIPAGTKLEIPAS